MNVLHICTADNSGGAAKAAYRLVQGLRSSGVDCTMLVAQKTEKSDANVDIVPKTDTLLKKVYVRSIGALETLTGLQYLLETWKSQFLDHPFVKNADIIHFHNIHSDFFPLRLVHELAEKKPIVWTCHDVWPMTGHCTYPDLVGCEKFTVGCEACPNLDDYPKIKIDTTKLLFSIKEKEYTPERIRKMIAPSAWMKQKLQHSRIFKNHEIVQIPYGVSTALYTPLDRDALRSVYKVEPDEKVLLFSALALDYERKGGVYLLKAIHQLRAQEKYNGRLLLIGLGQRGNFSIDLPGVRFFFPGLIDSDELMNQFYNLADVYVHPALADNLPNAVLESMAAGTPVIAFDVGGLPDMVRPGVTGALVAPKDTQDLAVQLKSLLSDVTRWAQLSASCRRVAESEYSLEIQSTRMTQLYKDVL